MNKWSEVGKSGSGELDELEVQSHQQPLGLLELGIDILIPGLDLLPCQLYVIQMEKEGSRVEGTGWLPGETTS